MLKVCSLAMQQLSLSRGDVLFHSGDTCSSMYFSFEGALLYKQHDIPEPLHVKSSDGDCFFCEAVLWVQWTHVGRMAASVESEVLLLDAEKMRTILTGYP